MAYAMEAGHRRGGGILNVFSIYPCYVPLSWGRGCWKNIEHSEAPMIKC